jgi:predicted glycoside hydrolase/deacetylase ChbG (UPF0249 family)
MSGVDLGQSLKDRDALPACGAARCADRDAFQAPPPSTAARRWLIINADDFGISGGTNAGIIAAHGCGAVTSTSLMVRWPAAARASETARRHPKLSVGLHLDLGEWAYRRGQWETVYSVVPLDDAEAVRKEIHAQLEAFRALMGKDPTHLDSHQHVHRDEPVRSLLVELGQALGVPVRSCTPYIHYCGDFYGQTGKGEPLPEAVTADALVQVLLRLPAGITELACHPGCDMSLATMYCRERWLEVRTLSNSAVHEAIDALRVELISFADVRSLIKLQSVASG